MWFSGPVSHDCALPVALEDVLEIALYQRTDCEAVERTVERDHNSLPSHIVRAGLVDEPLRLFQIVK